MRGLLKKSCPLEPPPPATLLLRGYLCAADSSEKRFQRLTDGCTVVAVTARSSHE